MGNAAKDFQLVVNIYGKKHDLCAEDLHLRVIGTEMVQGEFMERLGIRKCRARFHQLNEAQQAQVTNIIAKSSLS